MLERAEVHLRHDADGYTAVSDAAHPQKLLFRVARAGDRTIIEVRPRGRGLVRVDLTGCISLPPEDAAP